MYPNDCHNLIVPQVPESIDEVAEAYFYISGGQYTVEACNFFLKNRADIFLSTKKELDEHEVVIVWETESHILRCLSRALNLRLKGKTTINYMHNNFKTLMKFGSKWVDLLLVNFMENTPQVF